MGKIIPLFSDAIVDFISDRRADRECNYCFLLFLSLMLFYIIAMLWVWRTAFGHSPENCLYLMRACILRCMHTTIFLMPIFVWVAYFMNITDFTITLQFKYPAPCSTVHTYGCVFGAIHLFVLTQSQTLVNLQLLFPCLHNHARTWEAKDSLDGNILSKA